MRLDSVDCGIMAVVLPHQPGFTFCYPALLAARLFFDSFQAARPFLFADMFWAVHSVHFSTFLGHCENPYGSRRFDLQCRSVPLRAGMFLWYTCR